MLISISCSLPSHHFVVTVSYRHCSYCTPEGQQKDAQTIKKDELCAGESAMLFPYFSSQRQRIIFQAIYYVPPSQWWTLSASYRPTLQTLAAVHKDMSSLISAPACWDSGGRQSSRPRQLTILWGLRRPRQEATQRATESNRSLAPGKCE